MTLRQRIFLKSVKLLRPVLDDSLYLRLRFAAEMGYKLDLRHPRTFNEKLNWLKLYNRRPIMTRLVDKIAVKKWISEKIGSEYVIPTLKVWERVEDIDLNELPEKLVLKTNHGGGNQGVIVSSDKKALDLDVVKAKMRQSLESDIYRAYGEWPYKDVERKVFAEEFIADSPIDYKFYCFNGVADCVMACVGRGKGPTKFYFFNPDWELLRINKAGLAAPDDFTLPRPEGMDKMFEIAGRLSEGMPFARVDLYNVNGRIYFGEITFYPASGFDPNYLPETDRYFGDKIDLSLATIEI